VAFLTGELGRISLTRFRQTGRFAHILPLRSGNWVGEVGFSLRKFVGSWGRVGSGFLVPNFLSRVNSGPVRLTVQKSQGRIGRACQVRSSF
jgi:hypothetical protein